MMEEYINFVKELFPSIRPYTAKVAIESIKQFKSTGRKIEFFNDQPYDFLVQGDIVEKLLFTYITETGDEREIWAPGMMLSYTCDAENKGRVLFAPIISLENSKDFFDNPSIINNKYTSFFYIPDEDYYVDLSIVNSYSPRLIQALLDKGKVMKKSSLSTIGYYFLISKLTVHLLRPEDIELASSRKAV